MYWEKEKDVLQEEKGALESECQVF